MAAPPALQKAWQWPADVVAFAAEQDVQAYLDPLLEATWRVYPTARDVQVTLEQDPELRDVRCILFTVWVPRNDVPRFVEAVNRWTHEMYRFCPAPLTTNFCLSLLLVS